MVRRHAPEAGCGPGSRCYLSPMADDSKKDDVVVHCPKCNAEVRVSEREAQAKMVVTCPNGHRVELVRSLLA